MNTREHKGFAHGLRPGTTADMNCLSCRYDDAPPAADQLTGLPVETALFSGLEGRDLFLWALAARDLIVTEMADVPGASYRVSYLAEPLPAGPEITLTPAVTEDGSYSPEFLSAMNGD